MSAYIDPESGGFGSSDNPDLSNQWKVNRYNQWKSGQGNSGSSSQFDINFSPAPFDFSAQQQEEQDYLKSLTDKINSFESIPAMADKYSNQLGLPQLRNQVQTLGGLGEDITSALTDLPRGVAQRTTNSLVNEGQRGRIINAESQPLQQNLSEINRALGKLQPALTSGEQQLNQRLGYEMSQNSQQLLPFEVGVDLMAQRQAREFSGYTLQNQQELTRLIQNQQSGLTWTNAEKTRAHELAFQEDNYKNTIKLATYGGYGTQLYGLGNPYA